MPNARRNAVLCCATVIALAAACAVTCFADSSDRSSPAGQPPVATANVLPAAASAEPLFREISAISGAFTLRRECRDGSSRCVSKKGWEIELCRDGQWEIHDCPPHTECFHGIDQAYCRYIR